MPKVQRSVVMENGLINLKLFQEKVFLGKLQTISKIKALYY